MDISQEKINAKLVELNSGETGAPWTAIEGQNALMQTDFNTSGAVFNMGKAVVVKLFMNRNTGELKTFPLQMFKQDS